MFYHLSCIMQIMTTHKLHKSDILPSSQLVASSMASLCKHRLKTSLTNWSPMIMPADNPASNTNKPLLMRHRSHGCNCTHEMSASVCTVRKTDRPDWMEWVVLKAVRLLLKTADLGTVWKLANNNHIKLVTYSVMNDKTHGSCLRIIFWNTEVLTTGDTRGQRFALQ